MIGQSGQVENALTNGGTVVAPLIKEEKEETKNSDSANRTVARQNTLRTNNQILRAPVSVKNHALVRRLRQLKLKSKAQHMMQESQIEGQTSQRIVPLITSVLFF